MSQSLVRRRTLVVCVFALFALALGALAGCGGSSDGRRLLGGRPRASPATAIPASTSPTPASSAAADQRGNVAELRSRLEAADRRRRAAYGAYASTPVIADGVVYSQDLESNVQAIDLDSGEVLWTKRYERARPGPERGRRRRRQGLRRDRQRRLRARPGDRQGAVVDAAAEDSAKEAIDMAPGVPRRARSTSRPCRPTDRRHTTAAASACSGRSTRKTGEESLELRHRAAEGLWGDKQDGQRRRRPLVPALLRREGLDVLRHRQPGAVPGRRRASPGAKAGPAPTSTPTRWSSSTRRPARCEWYYQQTPHDLYDWDFQDPPILVEREGARSWRSAPASRGSWSPSTRRPASRSGSGGRQTQRPRRRRPAGDARRILEAQGRRGLPRLPGRRDRADGGERDDRLRPRRQPPDHGLRRRRKSAKRARLDRRNGRDRHRQRQDRLERRIRNPGLRGAGRGQRPRLRDQLRRDRPRASTRRPAAKSGRARCRRGRTPA